MGLAFFIQPNLAGFLSVNPTEGRFVTLLKDHKERIVKHELAHSETLFSN